MSLFTFIFTCPFISFSRLDTLTCFFDRPFLLQLSQSTWFTFSRTVQSGELSLTQSELFTFVQMQALQEREWESVSWFFSFSTVLCNVLSSLQLLTSHFYLSSHVQHFSSLPLSLCNHLHLRWLTLPSFAHLLIHLSRTLHFFTPFSKKNRHSPFHLLSLSHSFTHTVCVSTFIFALFHLSPPLYTSLISLISFFTSSTSNVPFSHFLFNSLPLSLSLTREMHVKSRKREMKVWEMARQSSSAARVSVKGYPLRRINFVLVHHHTWEVYYRVRGHSLNCTVRCVPQCGGVNKVCDCFIACDTFTSATLTLTQCINAPQACETLTVAKMCDAIVSIKRKVSWIRVKTEM